MAKRRTIRPPYHRVREQGYTHVASVTSANVVKRKSDGVILTNEQSTGARLYPIVIRMNDVVTPGFAQLQSEGLVVSNPMLRVAEEYTPGSTGFAGTFDTPAYANTQYSAMSGEVGTYLFGLPTPGTVGVNIDNLKTGASTAALAGMKNSSFQGLVAIAELKKTIGFLASPLTSLSQILSYLLQLRRGRINARIISKGNSVIINGRTFTRPGAWFYKGPGKLVKPPSGSVIVPFGASLSSSVLANNLGVKPMLMDWNALVHEIPNLHQGERLSSRATWQDEGNTTVATTGVHSVFSLPYTTTTNRKVVVRATALYEDTFDIMQDFGVTLSDIPETVWELVPASFIVDYFVNIGDLLGALKALATKDLLLQCLVVTTTDTVTRTFNGVSATNYKVDRSMSGTDLFKRVTKERLPNLGNPGLARVPLTTALRPVTVQNLLSLTVQQLSKLAKPGR